ncbi:hypothetical protein RDV64_03510 [Acuticoccus sp. MNP-M23]|uniref:hypothetical protein n=1 Tax=Acuticoccus sp. MNP-M23 TaxID=3072793 RepID=UPI0028163D9F|nr:hypothetical protein [Acuticoccus sp. MNP-M23]WMS43479.1 hypothetical protein RDV64_03510 [Acuticoccus sp. MNP-M23]
MQLTRSFYDVVIGVRASGARITETPGLTEAFVSPQVAEALAKTGTGFDPLSGGHQRVIERYELRSVESGRVDAAVLAGGEAKIVNFRLEDGSDGLRIVDIFGDGWTLANVAAMSDSASGSGGSLFDQLAAPATEAARSGNTPGETATLDIEALIAADGDEPVTAGGAAQTASLSLPFIDDFDGRDLGPAWQVQNPDTGAYIVEGSALTVISSGGNDTLTKADADNVFILEGTPAGDFDISLTAKLEPKTGSDAVELALFGGPENVIRLSAYIYTSGCGAQLYVGIYNTRAVGAANKSVTTSFSRSMFNGPFVKSVCSGNPGGRAYGDAILTALENDGFRLILSRRGPRYSGRLEMTLPANGDQPGGPAQYNTQAVAAFKVPGPVALLVGQGKSRGETVGRLERLEITAATAN